MNNPHRVIDKWRGSAEEDDGVTFAKEIDRLRQNQFVLVTVLKRINGALPQGSLKKDNDDLLASVTSDLESET